jgi:SP family general alpha glucoside:H+ symporter-like MFS transporter
MARVGRRKIYLAGLSAMVTILFAIGCTSFSHTKAASFATGSLLLVYVLAYDITIGTVCYSLVAEMPSSRLRTKTIVLARNLYNVQGTINGGKFCSTVAMKCHILTTSRLVITPYMLNPAYWNWKAKAGFFWAGTASLCLVYTYFRIPEPKVRKVTGD